MVAVQEEKGKNGNCLRESEKTHQKPVLVIPIIKVLKKMYLLDYSIEVY